MKQIYKKEDGTPILINVDNFDSDVYTDVQPTYGLYEPIYFESGKWIGVSKEEWLLSLEETDNQGLPDEKDEVIAGLTLQLLETQTEVESLQKDIASLTLTVLGGEGNA
ncbi:TPA: hypothetical protein I1596_000596 [Staphylococcus pseudintermedius]|uniref:hypothetical protein n=1 Tax=Staphylococcus pseudintermedius TaxID=283734 RepID=UPI001B8158E1|nr:hypothetical protein [Staphylococcus pseudintermedius]HAR5878509.1 hypothetical protein [Staphylococcus pseudintermedius]HAR5890733.1 hypothetical protein [Staphylococcus pseudintermedius]HAR5899018.1 hypothetical protein [Staphylococcus pseudintermedius]HAR5905613.1 hypothetical protein [Staphylococcus pseudintermedius]